MLCVILVVFQIIINQAVKSSNNLKLKTKLHDTFDITNMYKRYLLLKCVAIQSIIFNNDNQSIFKIHISIYFYNEQTFTPNNSSNLIFIQG